MTAAQRMLDGAREFRARLEDPYTQAHWADCDYPGDMPGVCNCDMKERMKEQNAALIEMLTAAIWGIAEHEAPGDQELREKLAQRVDAAADDLFDSDEAAGMRQAADMVRYLS